jgi:AcrR family transcriptional regulator
VTPAATAAPPPQRDRILVAARELMAEHGASATSMRQLASRCGLNVATLYHYFPSKAELLRAVIEDRAYLERLAVDQPPFDRSTPPRERFVAMLGWLWDATLQEESVWRLLVGEALRSEEVALESARALVSALDATFAGWLADRFPELRGDPAAAARLVRGLLFAQVVEHLVTGVDDVEQRATDLATLLFP